MIVAESADRVGLYIRPSTRNRLNLYKANLTLRGGRVISQDEAINLLLDMVNIPASEHESISEQLEGEPA